MAIEILRLERGNVLHVHDSITHSSTLSIAYIAICLSIARFCRFATESTAKDPAFLRQ